jgi:hypothetical protein
LIHESAEHGLVPGTLLYPVQQVHPDFFASSISCLNENIIQPSLRS